MLRHSYAFGGFYAVAGNADSCVVARQETDIWRPANDPAKVLLAFAELVVDQRDQGVHRSGFILTIRLNHDSRAFACGEHHDTHNAFGVDAAGVAFKIDFTLEAGGELGEFGGGSGVQAQFVDDFNVAFLHYRVIPVPQVC